MTASTVGLAPAAPVGGPAAGARRLLQGAAPLYVLLATDVANGLYALARGTPATGAALVVKAAVAAYLAARVRWTLQLVLGLLTMTACAGAWFALSPTAQLPSNAEANLLMLKSGAVVLLLSLVSAQRPQLAPQALQAYMRWLLLTVAASIALGMAGFGHERYEGEALLRSNGFLPAGNEMNAVLIALFWWFSERRHWHQAGPLDRRLYWLCLLAMVLSGSKTTIVGAVVVAAVFAVRRPGTLATFAVALPASLFLLPRTVVERWFFFYGRFLEEGMLSGLTSGRFGRAGDFIDNWAQVPLLGLAFMAGHGYVESDPLDLVLNFGLPGGVLFAMFALALWQAAGRRWLPLLLLLAISTLAGHLVYSVFAAPVLALAFAPFSAPRTGVPRRPPAAPPPGRAQSARED